MTTHTLTITYDQSNGAVSVNGPINNRGLCYLMLEMARDSIKDYAAANQRQIQAPSVDDISTLLKQ